MKELEELYKLANVKGSPQYIPSTGERIGYELPIFTTEKAWKLPKVLLRTYSIEIEDWEEKGYNFTFNSKDICLNITYLSITRPTFEEGIIQACIDLWDSLTDRQQEEIRKILES